MNTYVLLRQMNTIRAEYAEFSGLHEEGGWPKDINMNDPEMIQRHRKKLEKEDAFTIAVPLMADVGHEKLSHFFHQVYKSIFGLGNGRTNQK